MKICFVIPTLTSGGAERVAVTVLSALDGARHERVLYLFSSANAVYLDRVDPRVRIIVATQSSWVGRMRELAAFVRDYQPDIVMPFLSYFITAIAVRLAGTPSMVVFNQGTPTSGFLHDPDFSWRRPVRRRLFAAMTRYFYNRADAIVATSQGVADDLVTAYGVPRAKIRVLHNPVDLDAIAQQSREPIGAELAGDHPVVVAAGRLANVKNYPLLIAAIAELAQQTPVHVWVLGEGPEQARLEALARERGVASLVRFLGFQSNPWRFMARADAFALTSVYEGFGNVLVEAMACGTAVVATRSPGTLEIITNGQNGFLVDHDARSLASAIREMVTNRDRREAVVARAKESVAHYALPAVAARYDRLFEELTA
ncbi:MAG: glycosyltransferase [Vicinamibacterales bacterium]